MKQNSTMIRANPNFLSRDRIITYSHTVPYAAIIRFLQTASRISKPKRSAEADQGLIVAQYDSDLEMLESCIRSDHRVKGDSWLFTGRHLSTKEEAEALIRSPAYIIGTPKRTIDHIRRENIHPRTISRLVVITGRADADPGFWADIEYIVTRLGKRTVRHFFTPIFSDNTQKITTLLNRPLSSELTQWLNDQQEISMAKNDFQIDEGQIKDQLESIIREIHESEDPAELDEYRRLFNKNVSVFKRGYAAAYMLKYLKGERRPAPQRKKRPEPSGETVSVFIGIGRTRRVYPRDLVGLILDNTDLAREDIGNIKILDNYSFADINTDKADKVIEVLGGMEYRGRTLNVNFAKKKN